MKNILDGSLPEMPINSTDEGNGDKENLNYTWPFGMSAESPVGKVYSELIAACKPRHLSISRWKSNKNNYRVEIRYAVHTGERKAAYRFLPDRSVITTSILYHIEGTTERCEAYREFSRMLEQVKEYPIPPETYEGALWCLEHGEEVPIEILARFPKLAIEFGV